MFRRWRLISLGLDERADPHSPCLHRKWLRHDVHTRLQVAAPDHRVFRIMPCSSSRDRANAGLSPFASQVGENQAANGDGDEHVSMTPIIGRSAYRANFRKD
jgi:hypothetical protein